MGDPGMNNLQSEKWLVNEDTKLTRRDLVRRAAWGLAVAALPLRVASAADDVSPVMLKLSSYMSEARNSTDRGSHHQWRTRSLR